MPSPFPGMDPYFEAQSSWRDFHARVVTYLADQIAERLPENYVALIENPYCSDPRVKKFRMTCRPKQVTLKSPTIESVDGGRNMPSPFPGMDPYIEAQANWPDFHGSVMTYLRDQLASTLPEDYVARMEQQVRLESPDEDPEILRPDVLVARHDVERSEKTQSGVVTLEPIAVPFPRTHPELIRQRRVEIRRLPEMSLVTVIELLSPDNKKPGQGRDDYLAKRTILLNQAVHLVEIDLLLGGRRLPMGAALPAGNYYAFVARVENWPSCDVYAWNVRDRLPTIPIPLRLPDPDVPLDLAPPVQTAYDHGRYRLTTDYAKALSLPLEPDERAWAESFGRK